MYGRIISDSLPPRGIFSPSLFIHAADSFGDINDESFAEMQKALACCSEQLPTARVAGTVWICNICDRVWAVPEDRESGNNWALTRLVPVEQFQKDKWAYQIYWWLRNSAAAGASTFILFIAAIIAVVISDISVPYSSFLVYGTLGIGAIITALCVNRWLKYQRLYSLSVSL